MNNNILTFQQSQSTDQETMRNVIKDDSGVRRSYALCFILYFLQGNVISIGQTMPYLYKQLPSYKTLALFSTIDLPFSFKFLLSPFLEKYTNLTYGKRKTWIIISQSICSAILFVSSFFTEVTFATVIAAFLMASQLFLTIQDISLDSLSIKQTRSPEKASLIQSIAQPFGTVIGSLILLKFTSAEFAAKIGLSGSITTPTIIIRVISTFLFLTAIMMHLLFKQTALECQKRGKQKKFCQIVSYSKTFFHLNSKYCRTILFFLVYYQGLKFYEAGYDYELIKAGFSRDTSNSISNLIGLPVMGLTFYMADQINKFGLERSLIATLFAQCLLYTFNITVFSQNPKLLIFTQFFALTFITFKNMVLYIIINSFPIHALSGMYITIMLSVWNLGELKTLNTLIIDIFGWKSCAIFGICLQLVIIFFIPTIFEWIDQGVIQIDASISEEEDYIEQIDFSKPIAYSYLNQNYDTSLEEEQI